RKSSSSPGIGNGGPKIPSRFGSSSLASSTTQPEASSPDEIVASRAGSGASTSSGRGCLILNSPVERNHSALTGIGKGTLPVYSTRMLTSTYSYPSGGGSISGSASSNCSRASSPRTTSRT